VSNGINSTLLITLNERTTVYSTQEHITPKKAFSLFNDSIPYFCDENSSVFKIRHQALSFFIQKYNKDYHLALFNFFREWMPHWECTREFSTKNLFVFIQKISFPSIFFSQKIGVSITAPIFKHFTPKKDKIASRKKRIIYCLVCPSKQAIKISKSGMQICQGCATLLGKSFRKEWLSKEAKPEEITAFLRSRREAKKEKLAVTKRKLRLNNSYKRRYG